MSRRKDGPSEQLRWRITESDGRLRAVEVDMAPPLSTGEKLVWEGEARHIVEAYQRARASGSPVYLTREGFRLRRTKAI